jgi:serine/threonine protein kinase
MKVLYLRNEDPLMEAQFLQLIERIKTIQPNLNSIHRKTNSIYIHKQFEVFDLFLNQREGTFSLAMFSELVQGSAKELIPLLNLQSKEDDFKKRIQALKVIIHQFWEGATDFWIEGLHNDLKPANLLYTSSHDHIGLEHIINGEVTFKIGDFDTFSKINESSPGLTPSYASPEALFSYLKRKNLFPHFYQEPLFLKMEEIIKRHHFVYSDLYSFGSTVYELLYEKPPIRDYLEYLELNRKETIKDVLKIYLSKESYQKYLSWIERKLIRTSHGKEMIFFNRLIISSLQWSPYLRSQHYKALFGLDISSYKAKALPLPSNCSSDVRSLILN